MPGTNEDDGDDDSEREGLVEDGSDAAVDRSPAVDAPRVPDHPAEHVQDPVLHSEQSEVPGQATVLGRSSGHGSGGLGKFAVHPLGTLVERPKQLQEHKADNDHSNGRSGIDGQGHPQKREHHEERLDAASQARDDTARGPAVLNEEVLEVPEALT